MELPLKEALYMQQTPKELLLNNNDWKIPESWMECPGMTSSADGVCCHKMEAENPAAMEMDYWMITATMDFETLKM